MTNALDHLRRTHARFNRGAACYDQYASIQREAAARLMAQLGDLPEPFRILEAGCGSGQLTRMLIERFPRSRVDAFDISEAMLEAARVQVASTSIRWLHADFVHFMPVLPYPLVVSSSSLHWAAALDEAVRNLTSCTAPEGMLAISLMLDGTLGELHASREAVAPGKPVRRAMPELADLTLAVDQLGLQRLGDGAYDLQTRHESAPACLRCIHDQGLTGGLLYRPTAPLNRHELAALASEYQRRFSLADGSVPATYRIGWVIARCPS
jgi:malonyl-CoA O-methyltransferase